MFSPSTEPHVGTLTAPPTWEELASREPRLAALLGEARRLRRRRGPDFDPMAVFFGYPGCGEGFKVRLSRLVGWERPGNDPVLITSCAYDTVYKAILDALEGERP